MSLVWNFTYTRWNSLPWSCSWWCCFFPYNICLFCLANSTVTQLDRQADMPLQWKSGLDSQSYCLSSWSNNTSPCDWTGIACSTSGQSDAVPAVVLTISLQSCHISRGLDKLQFAELPHLQILNLGRSSFSGPIPSSIGGLAELSELDLSSNRLSGSIPTSIYR